MCNIENILMVVYAKYVAIYMQLMRQHTRSI
jgi:hypothetical protein